MVFRGKYRQIIQLFSGLLLFTAALLGTALGMSIAVNKNTMDMDELIASRPAIPSRVLDIHGDLITEFFSDEKRDITPITSLPENQIYAVLTREDSLFFQHTGFSLSGFFRALYQTSWYLLTRRGSLQGASTITMQLAGARHADRTDISLKRKLRELWWAYQIERRFTKQEILEQYLNTVYFGHNTYGVEAASQFFFGHSSRENSPAESVMLAIQLAGSGLYSPIIKPDAARTRQRVILNQMVSAGYISQEEADESFQAYWVDYDWSRSATDSPYFDRLANDKAPYFSEYIRSVVEQHLFGQQDIYRDGYSIYTTLNLDYQAAADREIAQGLPLWNRIYQNDQELKTRYASRSLNEMIELLSLAFNIPGIRSPGGQGNREVWKYLENELNPIMDTMSLAFGVSNLKSISKVIYGRAKTHNQMNNVETALITLGNDTGYILAMVGGSEFNRNNQFNRAVSANVMPGSAFKPLYYSAAISSGTFTASSLIFDGPEQFISPDGIPYLPGNYMGYWYGHVLLRDALARSLNIPALKVLREIGFDAAIKRSADLLGISDPQEIGSTFERVYPLGLGTLSVTPIRLARAYATIANRGRAVEPLAIRYIEDRDGNVVLNSEMELRKQQEQKNIQVLSPQAAYVMTSLLQSTVRYGTLAYARRSAGGFDNMPIAGKTGTTQNWTDAWTVGYSPYYTTVMWIGFDRRGNSLGRNQTGATSTGPVWARYMKSIHEDLPRIDFPRPASGLVNTVIDVRTGMKPAPDTPKEFTRYEVFIAGTQPSEISDMAAFEEDRDQTQAMRISIDSSNMNLTDQTESVKTTQDLFDELGLDTKYLDDTVQDNKVEPKTRISNLLD
ncbi:MAG: hypothetical protein B0D92_01530 [Spirochaeta sp. LUC14_002_19_P3]|nr:MAG: hypothetical protein B0D92_01530 [Spirochaeta sp. LUC14_002_19_P3]